MEGLSFQSMLRAGMIPLLNKLITELKFPARVPNLELGSAFQSVLQIFLMQVKYLKELTALTSTLNV